MNANLNLKELRARADKLGVKYHHRAGADKILAAINAHMVEQQTNGIAEAQETDPVVPEEKIVPQTSIEYREETQKTNKSLAGALVRVRVQCMNENKKDWSGEIISVGSAKLGTFKKYVPFNNEPFHIPKIIYDMMSERNCSQFYTTKDERGQEVRRARQIKEFAIEVLPPLTPEELDDLKMQQAMRQGNR